MKVQKISHKRLYEDVLEQLITQIKEGTLPPGNPIPPERELAESFGISRGTLREAFRILESSGMIESRPGGGRYVCKQVDGDEASNRFSEMLNSATVENLYEVRLLLETGIAELAAQRATEEDINDLRRVLEAMYKDDPGENSYESEYFHMVLANATHNLLMAEMVRVNLDLLQKNRRTTKPRRRPEIIEEHRRILEAVMAHQPQEARDAMRTHLENARKFRLKHNS